MNRAQTASRALYESDFTAVKAEDVLLAMKGDPRLQYCDSSELLGTPVAKLASKFGLVASNCEYPLHAGRSKLTSMADFL